VGPLGTITGAKKPFRCTLISGFEQIGAHPVGIRAWRREEHLRGAAV
jgi:hypothetical protein